MRALGMGLLVAATVAGMCGAASYGEDVEPACAVSPHMFDAARPIAAARTLGGDPNPMVTVGEPARLTLRDARTMTLVAPPIRPVTDDERGGLVRLHVVLSGTYRVAIDAKAWIDIVSEGGALPSVAHSHGAVCSGIAKQVDFALSPGDYTVQVTGASSGTAPLDMLITKLP